jgi:hypothetical protein
MNEIPTVDLDPALAVVTKALKTTNTTTPATINLFLFISLFIFQTRRSLVRYKLINIHIFPENIQITIKQVLTAINDLAATVLLNTLVHRHIKRKH